MRLKQEKARDLQKRHETLTRNLTNFRNELAAIRSEADARDAGLPGDDEVINRARMVSRGLSDSDAPLWRCARGVQDGQGLPWR